MKKLKSIAIIPARGGSKRITNKNIRNFAGQPIIKYSIDAAIKSKCFDEVMVSTDSLEIAKLSLLLGAKVPFMRSKKNSTDLAMTIPVLEEVIKEYKKSGKEFDYLCCIYSTAPFINVTKLRSAKKILNQKGVDAVVTVMKFSYPIQRALKIENENATMFWPENYNKRSQDLEPAFHDCGQFYFMKTSAMLSQKILYPKNTFPYEIPESEAQDIDNEIDWKIAEQKFVISKNMQSKSINTAPGINNIEAMAKNTYI